jgi:putative component of toxin-antitoxin plasmid stabilization module
MPVWPREVCVYQTENGTLLMLGNFGDCRRVGEGVLELRLAFGGG